MQVTGLADVMDIVHKQRFRPFETMWPRFLNRDVEHEQLKSSVKEAEALYMASLDAKAMADAAGHPAGAVRALQTRHRWWLILMFFESAW